MDEKQININDQVMDKISHGKVQMRPHWKFLAENIGLESGVLLSLVLAVCAASLLMYYWRVNELPRLAGFGQPGLRQILINFPYELIAAICLLLLLVNYIIKRMDWGYRHSWVVWIGASGAFIILGAGAALAFNLNEQVEAAVQKNNLSIAQPFYQNRIHNIANNVVLGRVESIKGDEIKLTEYFPGQASNTRSVTLKKSEIKIESKKNQIKAGEDVRLLGETRQGEFTPWGLLEVTAKKIEKIVEPKQVEFLQVKDRVERSATSSPVKIDKQQLDRNSRSTFRKVKSNKIINFKQRIPEPSYH